MNKLRGKTFVGGENNDQMGISFFRGDTKDAISAKGQDTVSQIQQS